MLQCHTCGAIFPEIEGITAAERKYQEEYEAGTYACPCCGAERGEIQEYTEPTSEESHSKQTVTRHPIQVSWVNCNEGYSGDYDPDDPEDENLLRLDVSHYDSETEEYEETESVCTCFPANTPWEIRQAALDALSYLFWEDHNSPGGSNLRMLIGTASFIDPDNIQMIVDKTKELRVRRIAYERFQLYWLATHGFSMRDVFQAAHNWAKDLHNDMLTPEDYSFEAHIDEQGFGQGSLYPCFREFLGAEFCIPDLMKLLLDEDQFAVWQKDPIVLAHKDTDPALVRNTEN